MTTIRELITSWGFVVDDKALDAVDKKLATLKKTVAVVGGAAIGAAAGIFGLASSAGAAGAEVQRAADRIGISVEALQEYQYAARVAGQSNEGFQGSLQTLIKNLFDARRGLGSSREAFYLLGTALGKDLLAKGLSAEEVLNNVADGLTKVTDKSRKLELASQLFGGDAGAMLTTLAGGSAGLATMRREALATGVVMGGEATRAAVAYQAALERTKSTVVGLKNTVGVALFPVVERVMGSFRRWILVNRQWLASGLHEGLATLATFVARVLFVAERAGSVVNTTAIAFGGWNRVLKLVTAGMVLLLTLRTASFFGQLILAAGKVVLAMRAMGAAGLLAQIEVAAVPLAIGAAFIGLALIIEDIVAYFQGRKSITGLIVKDFAGLEGKITAWLDPVLDRMKSWGKALGKSIVDGIAGLSAEDIGKFADTLKKALLLAFDLATIPVQIGFAIAGGIIDGLVDGIRRRFPTLAAHLGLDKLDEKAPVSGPVGRAAEAFGVDTPMNALKTLSGYQNAKDLIEGAPQALQDIKDGLRALGNMLSSSPAARRPDHWDPRLDVVPTPPPSALRPSAGAGGAPTFNIDATQNITVPPGTPAERITPTNTAILKDTLSEEYRKTRAALAPAGPY